MAVLPPHKTYMKPFLQCTLPPPQELESYRLSFKPIATTEDAPKWAHPGRGAPPKPTKFSIDKFHMKNTKGERFKFSFIPQILIAHFQHLLGLKCRSRYKAQAWLRLHTAEGAGLCEYIRKVVKGGTGVFEFKRIVSMHELQLWLLGQSHCGHLSLSAEEISAKRIGAFRLFCMLKCIDLQNQCWGDFNVAAGEAAIGGVLKEYLLRSMWRELGIVAITEEEFKDTLSVVIH